MTLVVPTIHLNGTGKKALLSEYVAAMNALHLAIDALHNVTVHGRDYYVQDENAIFVAMEQRREQFAKLESVRSELEAIAIAIDEQ
jgi:hypothetical protein